MNPWLRTIRCTIVMLSMLCVTHSAIAENPALTLDEAIKQLDSAIDQSQNSDSGTEVREAAAALEYAMEREGVETADGHLALGNAYLIGDDLGRAILHYRRGLSIEPSNKVLRENLDYARSFVEPTVPDTGSSLSLSSALRSWHRVMDGWTLWIASVLLLGIASLLWTLRSVGSSTKVTMKLPIGLMALAFVGFGLLGFDQWTRDHSRGLVVVMPGVSLYSGPGTGVYQAVYDGPLGIGTEAVALEQRDGWTNIRLGNNQDGWIMTDSTEYIEQ